MRGRIVVSMKNVIYYFSVYIRGMCMGAADVVPGISGGTIAFITGVYDTLVKSLSELDIKSFSLLMRGRMLQFAKKTHLLFLATLLAGILTSIILFSELITYLLVTYEELVWGFFFGLVLASSVIVLKQIHRFKPTTALLLVVGVVVGYLTVTLSFVETPHTALYVFFSGSIAIVAAILPGISGSFILLILGKYEFILTLISNASNTFKRVPAIFMEGGVTAVFAAVMTTETYLLTVFAAGSAVGLVVFAKILRYLLKNYFNAVMALLTGFMLGSLYKVWPWKEGGVSGEVNTFPSELTLYLGYTIAAGIVGVLIVYAIYILSGKKALY